MDHPVVLDITSVLGLVSSVRFLNEAEDCWPTPLQAQVIRELGDSASWRAIDHPVLKALDNLTSREAIEKSGFCMAKSSFELVSQLLEEMGGPQELKRWAVLQGFLEVREVSHTSLPITQQLSLHTAQTLQLAQDLQALLVTANQRSLRSATQQGCTPKTLVVPPISLIERFLSAK